MAADESTTASVSAPEPWARKGNGARVKFRVQGEEHMADGRKMCQSSKANGRHKAQKLRPSLERRNGSGSKNDIRHSQ